MEFKVVLKGKKRIARRMDAIPEAMKAGLAAGALHVKGTVDRAPRVRRGAMRWKTRKQRFWFLMALREGKIEVPYIRNQNPLSEGLTKKWTLAEENNGLRWRLGNNASYGPYVQDKDLQSLYHKQTGWKTTEAIVVEEGLKVVRLVQAQIRWALDDRSVLDLAED